MKETLRPLGDKIVVRREEAPKSSDGGILLPDNAKEKPTRGVVVAVGPGKVSPSDRDDVLVFNYVDGNVIGMEAAVANARKCVEKENRIAVANPRPANGDWPAVEFTRRTVSMSVKVGDVVLFTSYAGNSVEINGEELLIMREDDILCVVENSK